MNQALETALKNLYEALHADDNNASVDGAIKELKNAMVEADVKDIEVSPTELPNNTREGRRMLKSYAKKRGVSVTYPKIG